jgi:TolB-like protein/Tfp pilus assembly protein PilF
MPSGAPSDPNIRIAHVLTIDVVGYSTLLITEQTRIMAELTRIVKETARFQGAEAAGKLLRLPTGDGMLLIFFDDVQAPLECAMEIAAAIKSRPEIRLRMGIHSGPVNEIVDVNDRSNVAGAGVDLAQRVMDCGDAGHILLSKRVAEDLAPFPQWNPHLHDLGECEVKHGRKVSLVNFYTDKIGNPEPPAKCRAGDGRAAAAGGTSTAEARSPAALKRAVVIGAVVFIVALAAGILVFLRPNLFQLRDDARTAQATSHSIAVLPFENASNDPNAEYLSEGISEALINSLAEVQQLRVIARATAFHYKGKMVDPKRLGRELQVEAVLSGKVRQMQDMLSVQVDLVDANTGAQLWGEQYERKVSDVLAVKQTITREVTEKLRLRLSDEEQRKLTKRDTTNAEAYQVYLRGRYVWNKRTKEGLRKGIEYFRQAIDTDPNYALAYVGLADSYNFLGAFGIALLPPGEAMPKAKSAAMRALEIDDSLAEAHASLAFVRLYYDWDWAGAEKAFQRAIELNPNYAPAPQWYSHLLMSRGRTDEALSEAKRAAEIDPLSLPAAMNLGWQYHWARQYDLAVKCLRKALEIDPNFEQGRWGLGLAYEGKGLIEEAATEFQKAVNLSGGNPVYAAALGHAYAIGGKKAEAMRTRAELEEQSTRRYVSPYWMATLHAGLGDKDQAFQWLEKAYEERSGGLIWLGVDPRMDGLRSDPRFAVLMRRIGQWEKDEG